MQGTVQYIYHNSKQMSYRSLLGPFLQHSSPGKVGNSQISHLKASSLDLNSKGEQTQMGKCIQMHVHILLPNKQWHYEGLQHCCAVCFCYCTPHEETPSVIQKFGSLGRVRADAGDP